MSERRGRPPARFSPSLADQTGERRSEGLKDRRKGDGQRSSERLSVQRSGKSKNEAQGSVEIDVVNLGPEEAAFVPRPPQSIGRKRKRQEQTAPAISPQPTPTDEECIDVAGTSLEEEQEDHDSSAENPPQLAPAEAIENSAAYDALRSILPGPTPSGIAAIHLLLESTQPEQTDYGDYYLTVIPRRLTEFYRKESVLNIVANYALETRELGWVNRTAPIIPPFSGEPGNYLFLVDGSKLPPSVLRQDALSPWSRNKDEIVNGVPKPHTRCKQRHFPVVMETGRYQIAAGERAQEAIYRLHEYTATHPHCARLKKRIYYLERDGTVFGNYMVLYEFTGTGGYPKLTKKMEHMLEMLRKGDELPLLACIPGQETRFAQMDTSEQLDIEEMIEVDGDIEGEVFIGEERRYASSGNYQPSLPDRSAYRKPDWSKEPFDDQALIEMEDGGRCVRAFTPAWAKEKVSLLKFLVNEPGSIKPEWISEQKPFLPPLVEHTTAFVFFVETANIDFSELTADGLVPWTGSGCHSKTRKLGLKKTPDGSWTVESCRNWRRYDTVLVEYSSTLGRCPRLRKRIFYVRSHGLPIGRCIFSYEYLEDGPIPELDREFLAKKDRIDNMRVQRRIIEREKQNALFPDYLLKPDEIDREFEHEEVIIGNRGVEINPVAVGYRGLQAGTSAEAAQWAEEDFPGYGGETPLEFEHLAGYRLSKAGDICVRISDPANFLQRPTLLDHLVNDAQKLADIGLVQGRKPSMVPLTTQDGAFAFFFNSTAADRPGLYRDALSPWNSSPKESDESSSSTKTQRAALRKAGDRLVVAGSIRERCDTSAESYLCEHSVTHFKYPRLRRKIFFVVTRDEQLIGNVIILYLYAEKGALPALPSGSTLANVEFVQISEETPIYDLLDVVDTIQLMPNALFARVLDTRLLHDKRRILELAFNQAATVSELGLLNDKVPGMPPQTQMTGCFVCFVDTKSGALVDQRQLTIDALAPWSEGQRGAAIFIRPKYKRYQLYRSNENARRLELCWNAGEAAVEDNASEFSLVVYTATLPRCQRLKKRIYYVMCGRCLVGNAVIFYNYEVPGPLPTEVAHGNVRRQLKPEVAICPSTQPQNFDFYRHRIDIHKFFKMLKNDELAEKGEWKIEKRNPDQAGSSSEEQDKIVAPLNLVNAEVQKRVNAVLDFAAFQFNCGSEKEVLDVLFRVLVQRNETHLLQNVRDEYGIEILTQEEPLDVAGENPK